MSELTPIIATSKRSHGFAIVWTRCELLLEQTVALLVEATRTYETHDNSLDLARLEPRILLSATPIAPVVDADAAGLIGSDAPAPPVVAVAPAIQDSAIQDSANQETAPNQDPLQKDSQRTELVVIDPRSADSEWLLNDLSTRSPEGTRFEILRLDAKQDGVAQIGAAIKSYGGIDAIHIVTHGSEGRFSVGSTLLSSENIESYATELSRWQSSLRSDADILIYGCDVAGTKDGQAFVTRIATLTGADVAASIDATGNATLGGNWNLEFSVGQIQTNSLLTTSTSSQWSGLLQAITVTTTNDVVDGNVSSIAALLASRGNDGFISLREAIIAANSSVGSDVIFLSNGTYSLSITGVNENNAATGDLDIRDDLEIRGIGSGSTIINGAGIDRVFEIRDTAQVTITGLTVRGGNGGTDDGGGIYVLADANSLTLQQVVVTNNSAGKGAGVFVREGTLNIYETTISNNTSSVSGGGLYNDKGNVGISSSAILQNTATTSGGGIFNGGSGAKLTLTNTTVSGNSSSGQGGGIYNKRDATLVHTTIAYNSAANGGGIYFDTSGTLAIRNSILANNTGGNSNTVLTGSLGNNLSDNSSSGLTHASDIIDANPMLGTLGNYGGATQTIAVLTGSAAINAGAATGVSQFDQRGLVRDISADIGAFEYQRLATTGELSINSTTGSIQETSASSRGSQHAVAITSSGEYVVVWSSNQSTGADGDGYSILMRRYSSSGTPITGEIQVNQFTSGDQRWATVALDNAGNGVVVWTSTGQDASATGIYARRFDQSGAFVGNEFRINTTTSGSQSDAVVAMNGNGQFVIAWQGNGSGDGDGIFYRRFDAAGAALDANEVLANSSNLGIEEAPSVALNDAGQFAISWHVGNDLYVRHFSANGTAVFSDLQVDNGLANAVGSSSGIDSTGRTVIVYRTDGLSGIGAGIWGRGFNANGSQLYPWFMIASGDATSPSIDMNADGSFIVVWNASSDSDGQAVMARQFNSSGGALSAAYRVNSTQTGNQSMASVAMLDSENYVVAWSGQGPGDTNGVVVRQFGTTLVANTAPVAINDTYRVDRGSTIQVESYPDWFNLDWQFRQHLTVPIAGAAVELPDYPVLVRLHASAVDAVQVDYSKLQNDGRDLRFVDANGALLSYQIETWNTAGYSQVWVKIPLLENAHSRNTFSMYYGNSGAANVQVGSAVWDAESAGVYHFNNVANDATTPAQNGIATSIVYSTGVVGQAATFNGTTSGINVGSDASLDDIFVGGGTISAWIKPVDFGEGGFGRIVDKALTTNGGGGYAFQIAGTTPANGQLIFEQGFSGTVGRWRTNPGTIMLNSWQNVVITYDNTSASNVPIIYIDGVQQSLVFSSNPSGTASSDAAQDLVIGNRSNTSDRTFNGQIDELRISSTIRSSDWVAQQYRTIVSAPTISASVQSRPTGLLVNDSDADVDPLTVTLVSGPAHATSFTLNNDGSFTYQHNGDFIANDSFTYRLSDGQGGVSTATANIAIQWVNSPPTVSVISDRLVAEDTSSGAIAFTIGDVETAANSLVVTAASSNPSLIANAGILLGGTGTNRTITLTPQSNATGAAVITVTVNDGTTTAVRSFNVNVTPVNDAPTISAIANRTINEDTSTGAIAFTIGDVETAANSLVVTAASSNPSLIANAGILLGGTGTNRTITFTPQSNATGTAVITVTVDDGTTTAVRTFNVTVTPANDAPTISAIANQALTEDTSSSAIAFAVGDVETAASSLVVTASSSNQSLIANAGILLGGAGSNRTITLTPKSNATGTAVITVAVNDGTTTSTRSFLVTVDAVNDAPIAVADSITADPSAPTLIRRSSLLANDIEPDGDVLTIEIVDQPSLGTLDVLLDGNLRYQHTAAGTVPDLFTYRIFDGMVWSDPIGVTVNISSMPPSGFIPATNNNSVAVPSQNQSDSEGNSAEPSQPESKSNDSPAIDQHKDVQPTVASLAGMIIASGTPSTNHNAKVIDNGLMMADSGNRVVTPYIAIERVSETYGTVKDRERSVSTATTQETGSDILGTTISTYGTTRFTVTQPQLWLALDSMKQEISTSLAVSSDLTVGAAATTSVGMTVGYVVWVLRSGLLLSSVMAHLPMWRFMDPLAILDSSETHADEDDETLGSIADGTASAESVDQHEVAEIESIDSAVKTGVTS